LSLGCRRLGRVPEPQGHSHRLLMHLNSESCASDLLKAAKSLHHSSNYCARSAFVNPDLNPASVKLAYERREQHYKLCRERDISSSINNTVIPTAAAVATLVK